MYGLVVDDSKLHFSSSHFLAEHDKCERLHGHNYQLRLEVESGLGKYYMVTDFKDIKDIAGALCDYLDHKILLPANSKELHINPKGSQIEVQSNDKFYSFPKGDCLLIPTLATTAEELARYIYEKLQKDVPGLKKVYVAESEGATAYYLEE